MDLSRLFIALQMRFQKKKYMVLPHNGVEQVPLLQLILVKAMVGIVTPNSADF